MSARSMAKFPLRYNQKFIFAVLHHLLVVVVVVVVVVVSTSITQTVKGIYKAETLHNDGVS